MSRETARLQARHGYLSPRIWDDTIEPLAARVLTDLAQLTQPRDIGDWMRKTGPIVVQADADASTYRIGYRISTPNGKAIRGNTAMTPRELELDHTPQENRAQVMAGEIALQHADIRVPDSSPFGIMDLGGDNIASCINLNKPGPKPSMVLQAVGLHVAARATKPKPLLIRGTYRNKNYMDNVTMIDHDSRLVFRLWELGLRHQLVAAIASALKISNFSYENSVDGMACRATRQTLRYISRYPDAELGRLPQCDIVTYHLGSHPALQGRVLYLYPPESMLPTIIQQIIEQQSVDQQIMLTVPCWQKAQNWGPMLLSIQDRVIASALIPFNTDNFVHPGGSDHLEEFGRQKWPLITLSLLRRECAAGGTNSAWHEPSAQLTKTATADHHYYLSSTSPNSATSTHTDSHQRGHHY